MAYFVTGATGFIGRYLVQELLENREGDVFVLVRPSSRRRFERLALQWGHQRRVHVVEGDLAEAALGVDRGWVAEHDWQDVGPRFLEPIPDGKYQGFTIARWLPGLVYEYYKISGRHEKTGRPYMDTLQRLGLEEFKEWSQLD